MNNLPRQTLRRLISKYGNDLGGNARRCEGLLKDLCGEYRREINVLTSAIEERIPLDLLAAGNSIPRELLLTKLAKRLEDNLGLTAEAAQWAVDSWALALGIASEAEIEAKEKIPNNSAQQIPPLKPPQPISQNPPIQKPRIKQPPQTQQKPPLKVYPPVTQPTVNVPMPASNFPPQRTGSNINVPQNLPPRISDPSLSPAPKKRFRKFFGCLFIFFLLIVTGVVLFFGVPYAINVMRETQQRNEPPRFPSQ
jgi:hypothetical protein